MSSKVLAEFVHNCTNGINACRNVINQPIENAFGAIKAHNKEILMLLCLVYGLLTSEKIENILSCAMIMFIVCMRTGKQLTTNMSFCVVALILASSQSVEAKAVPRCSVNDVLSGAGAVQVCRQLLLNLENSGDLVGLSGALNTHVCSIISTLKLYSVDVNRFQELILFIAMRWVEQQGITEIRKLIHSVVVKEIISRNSADSCRIPQMPNFVDTRFMNKKEAEQLISALTRKCEATVLADWQIDKLATSLMMTIQAHANNIMVLFKQYRMALSQYPLVAELMQSGYCGYNSVLIFCRQGGRCYQVTTLDQLRQIVSEKKTGILVGFGRTHNVVLAQVAPGIPILEGIEAYFRKML